MIRTYKYGEITKDEIFARTEPTVNVEAVVADIIENVKKDKDNALIAYSEKFDGVKLGVVTGDASGDGVVLLILQFVQTVDIEIRRFDGNNTGTADDGKHQRTGGKKKNNEFNDQTVFHRLPPSIL